jgi:hypothetical protein
VLGPRAQRIGKLIEQPQRGEPERLLLVDVVGGLALHRDQLAPRIAAVLQVVREHQERLEWTIE